MCMIVNLLEPALDSNTVFPDSLNRIGVFFNPTINDDYIEGYVEGSRWINKTTNTLFTCTDTTTGTAVWV